MRTRASLLASALVITACQPAEQYGFVARLGDDTTSIERITRSSGRITSDLVQRSPQVIRMHWEARTNPDGSLARWTATKSFLNHRQGEPADAEYEAVFEPGIVHVQQRVGGERKRYDITDVPPVTAPWEAFDYGLYELLFEAARRQPGDTLPIRQYMTGFGNWSGRGVITKLGGERMSITSGGLAGAGVGRVDEQGRMLSYSGAGTTFRQEVDRVEDVSGMNIDAIAMRFAREDSASPPRALSMRDTARGTVGAASILVDYGRPLRRGRDILGNVVPYGAVWRTGANAATQLIVSAPVTLGRVQLQAGTYTLFTLPTRDSVSLLINRQTGQWGTQYDPRMDLARVPLRSKTLTDPVDSFTIKLEPGGGDTALLALEWDRFSWSTIVTEGR